MIYVSPHSLRIITSQGLAFLHSQRVVHRDLMLGVLFTVRIGNVSSFDVQKMVWCSCFRGYEIPSLNLCMDYSNFAHFTRKSMNILLDSRLNAKICDFGLAHQMCMESLGRGYKCDLYIGRPAECEDHNISGVGGYWIFGIIHHSLEKTRSTHIARKLDGEGGSPRYMAPECAWDHNFREGVMSSWWMNGWMERFTGIAVSFLHNATLKRVSTVAVPTYWPSIAPILPKIAWPITLEI